VSGCGSTKTTSTSASNGSSPQTVSQSTGSTEAQDTASKARESKAAEARRLREQAASKRNTEAVKRQIEAIVKRKISPAVAEKVKSRIRGVPLKRTLSPAIKRKIAAVKRKIEALQGPVPYEKQYDTQEQVGFIEDCIAGNGSRTSCQCVLVKQELRHVPTGLSLAELLTLENALHEGVPFKQTTGTITFPVGGRPKSEKLPRAIRRNIAACLT